MKKLETIQKTITYSPSANSFRVNYGWTTCRDVFHSRNDISTTKIIEFSCKSPEKLANSIWMFERFLNIKEENLMILKNVEYRTVGSSKTHSGLEINLSPFWLENKARYYFLSVIIKSLHGSSSKLCNYHKMIKRLMKSKYCTSTPRATAMFLNGCTHNSKITSNWVNSFSQSKQGDIPLTFAKETKHFNDGRPLSNLTQADRKMLEEWVKKSEKIKYKKELKSAESRIRIYERNIVSYKKQITEVEKRKKVLEDMIAADKNGEVRPKFMLVGST